MRRWTIALAVAGLAGLYACSDSPLETSCCRMLTSIEVSPPSGTVPANGTLQFTATVRDENDEVVDTEVSWAVSSSAQGSVSPNGLFTASSEGTVYVRSTVGVLADSALVTITP
jgi:uncharacterized protein YjdB